MLSAWPSFIPNLGGHVGELAIHELCEIYDAEHKFVEGQQEMAQHATDGELESAIQEHIEQTRLHIRNLEEVFGKLGQEPRRETNEVAQGLVSEAQEGIREAQNDAVCDCAIVAAVMKVEHFEMGSYRGLISGAQQMGQQEVVNLLSENLHQEEETARTAEQSAPQLIQKAMHQQEAQEEGAEEGLIDKPRTSLAASKERELYDRVRVLTRCPDPHLCTQPQSCMGRGLAAIDGRR